MFFCHRGGRFFEGQQRDSEGNELRGKLNKQFRDVTMDILCQQRICCNYAAQRVKKELALNIKNYSALAMSKGLIQSARALQNFQLKFEYAWLKGRPPLPSNQQNCSFEQYPLKLAYFPAGPVAKSKQ